MTAAELAMCDRIARERQDLAIKGGRTMGNNGVRGMEIERRGVRGEFAAKCFFDPVIWHSIERGDVSGMADLDDFVDVKTQAQEWHNLIVQFDDHADWAYVAAWEKEPGVVKLTGWAWGWEVQHGKYKSDPVGGRAAYFVPENDLRCLSELTPIIRHRQACVSPQRN